jgi:hypothetical protein
MRAIVVLPLLLTGCYPLPDCASGYTRNDAGKCKGGTALSGDTGLSDTGGFTQADFSGPISISILAETDALVLEDVCEGQVDITFDGAVIDGTLSCVFGGTVGGIIGSDPFEGTLTGDVSEDGVATGPLDMDLAAFGALAATWSGTATPEGVQGTFGEETLFVIGALEVPVTYDGTFTAR